MADKVEITATLEHAKITDPAKDTDGKYYVNAKSKSITLKADEGCTFETAGSFVYQGSYDELTGSIPASKTDTVVYTLPTFDLNDQYQPITLTMSATKKSTPEPPTKPTTTPTKPTPTTTPTTSTAPTTQLDILKNSLRIPLDLKDDDTLLQSYLDGATEYLKSTLDEENALTKINSKRAKVIVNALAELMYQNRGDDTVTKDLPFTLRALINQLKY